MSLATRRALYGKLAGDTTLTTQLETPPPGYAQAIFYQSAPPDAKFPYLIFQRQAGAPTYAMKKKAFDSEVWLVKAVNRVDPRVAGAADVVDNIASRLDALLTDGALSISGATQLYLRRESDVDYSEAHEGAEYKHAGSLYRLITEAA